MSKKLTIAPGLEPENIEVLNLMGDRLILRIIPVEKKKTSNIINPETQQEFEDEAQFDRWQLRAEIVHVGEYLKEKHPFFKKGAKVWLESNMAATKILINHEEYIHTRASNVMLVYQDK